VVLRLGFSLDSPIAGKNVLGAKRLFCFISAFLHFPSFFPKKSQSCSYGPIAHKLRRLAPLNRASTAPQTTKIRVGLSLDSPKARKNVLGAKRLFCFVWWWWQEQEKCFLAIWTHFPRGTDRLHFPGAREQKFG
jgi:hypothetical protein